jgi:hypothetical protein
VFGSDLSTSGTFNAGVRGVSVRGIGVAGQSTSGTGVSGISTSNNGVFGDSQAAGASGIYGQNDGGGFGVAGRLTKPGLSAVLADAGSTGSPALSAQSAAGVGANIVGGFRDSISLHDFPALSIIGNTTISGGNTFLNDLIDACPSGTASPCSFMGGQVFRLFQTGDLVIAGRVFTSGSCSSGCSVANALTETRVRFYTPQESLPTVEDFGEAQLVNGQAYVRIDSAFANTIDPRASYMVIITPEGDSNGLYVTAKTPTSFEVHENRGGRSTLAFSYRIVAKPYGENASRLQRFVVRLPRAGASLKLQ